MDDKTIKLLEEIKSLLILQLDTQEVPGTKIADVLGVNQSTVSRILSPKKVEKNKGGKSKK